MPIKSVVDAKSKVLFILFLLTGLSVFKADLVRQYLDDLKTPVDRNIASSIYDYLSPHEIEVIDGKAHFQFEDFELDFEVSVLSESEAQSLFQFLAARKDIAFKFIAYGCEPRAHKMALLLEEKNIQVGKVFVLGDLQVDNPRDPAKPIRWPEHVAPFVVVQGQEGLKKFILDPSLFDRAVEVDTWLALMTQHQPKSFPSVYYTPRFYYQVYSFTVPTKNYQDYEIGSMKSKLKEYLELQNSGSSPEQK